MPNSGFGFLKCTVLVLMSKERGIGLRCDKVNSTHDVYQELHMLIAGIYKVQMYLQVSTSKMFRAVQCHHTPSSHEFCARWTVCGAGEMALRLSTWCSWKRPEFGPQHLLWVVHNSSSRVSPAFFWPPQAPSLMCTETHKQPCSQN